MLLKQAAKMIFADIRKFRHIIEGQGLHIIVFQIGDQVMQIFRNLLHGPAVAVRMQQDGQKDLFQLVGDLQLLIRQERFMEGEQLLQLRMKEIRRLLKADNIIGGKLSVNIDGGRPGKMNNFAVCLGEKGRDCFSGSDDSCKYKRGRNTA